MEMNKSFATIGPFAEQLQKRSTATEVIEFSLILLINLVSFTGNLLVGIAVCKNPNLRKTVPNLYILNLAVSDFLMSVLGIPFSVAAVVIGKWPFGFFVCQFQGFWILLMCAVSLQTLAVTAVNRYFRIVRSRAQYQKFFNMKKTKATILFLWIVGLLAPLPYLFAGHEFSFHAGKVFCAHNAESLHKGFGAYLVLFYVSLPQFIIIASYIRVFVAVRKHNLVTIRPQICGSRQSNTPNLSFEEINVTYTLVAVVLGFLICWTPVAVIDLIDFINEDWKLKREVYVSYTCCGFASSSLNPIIYGIMNRSFRAEYLNILAPLKKWLTRKTSDVHVVSKQENVPRENHLKMLTLEFPRLVTDSAYYRPGRIVQTMS